MCPGANAIHPRPGHRRHRRHNPQAEAACEVNYPNQICGLSNSDLSSASGTSISLPLDWPAPTAFEAHGLCRQKPHWALLPGAARGRLRFAFPSAWRQLVPLQLRDPATWRACPQLRHWVGPRGPALQHVQRPCFVPRLRQSPLRPAGGALLASTPAWTAQRLLPGKLRRQAVRPWRWLQQHASPPQRPGQTLPPAAREWHLPCYEKTCTSQQTQLPLLRPGRSRRPLRLAPLLSQGVYEQGRTPGTAPPRTVLSPGNRAGRPDPGRHNATTRKTTCDAAPPGPEPRRPPSRVCLVNAFSAGVQPARESP